MLFLVICDIFLYEHYSTLQSCEHYYLESSHVDNSIFVYDESPKFIPTHSFKDFFYYNLSHYLFLSIAKGSNDEIVAVKASRTTTKQNELLEYELSFKTEQEFMYKFKHPNILKCLDGFYDTEKKKFVLILEFMQNGSLRTYLANLIHSGKSLLSNERNAMIG